MHYEFVLYLLKLKKANHFVSKVTIDDDTEKAENIISPGNLIDRIPFKYYIKSYYYNK